MCLGPLGLRLPRPHMERGRCAAGWQDLTVLRRPAWRTVRARDSGRRRCAQCKLSRCGSRWLSDTQQSGPLMDYDPPSTITRNGRLARRKRLIAQRRHHERTVPTKTKVEPGGKGTDCLGARANKRVGDGGRAYLRGRDRRRRRIYCSIDWMVSSVASISISQRSRTTGAAKAASRTVWRPNRECAVACCLPAAFGFVAPQSRRHSPDQRPWASVSCPLCRARRGRGRKYLLSIRRGMLPKNGSV